jgi:hypothetical protein
MILVTWAVYDLDGLLEGGLSWADAMDLLGEGVRSGRPTYLFKRR